MSPASGAGREDTFQSNYNFIFLPLTYDDSNGNISAPTAIYYFRLISMTQFKKDLYLILALRIMCLT
jgi:hypothetical protein